MSCRINLRAGRGFGQRDRAFLLERLSTADGAAGQRPQITFGGEIIAGIVDKIGRYGHLVGLAFVGRASFVAGAGMPSPCTGVLQYSVIRDMRLTAGGHEYLAGGVDLMDLDDDNWMQSNDPLSIPPADIAVGAGAVTRDFEVVWTFGAPHDDEREPRALDYSIPLSLLDPSRDTTAGLTFQIAGDVQSGGGDVGTFPGLTSGGFITPGEQLEIWAVVRYADELHVDAPWQLRVNATTDTKILQNTGAICDYAVIRDRVNAAGAWLGFGQDESDYSQLRVIAGDELVVDGRTARETARAANYITAVGDRVLSGAAVLTPRVIANPTLPVFLPLVWGVGGKRRAGDANGELNINYVRTAHGTTRMLSRGVGLFDDALAAKAMACMPGRGEGSAVYVAPASPNNKAAQLAAVLPAMIVNNK